MLLPRFGAFLSNIIGLKNADFGAFAVPLAITWKQFGLLALFRAALFSLINKKIVYGGLILCVFMPKKSLG